MRRLRFLSIIFTAAVVSSCLNAAGDENADIDYLIENRQKAGVTETESGLQYRILEEGDVDGQSPGPTSEVSVYYTGWFVDGRKFDGTKEGESAEFHLNEVIAGWTEGIQLMTVGSKYEFVIPSDLGYGDPGYRIIPPGATLIFEVKLLAIL